MRRPSKTRKYTRGLGRSVYLCTAAWRKTCSCWNSSACLLQKICCTDASVSKEARNEGKPNRFFGDGVVVARIGADANKNRHAGEGARYEILRAAHTLGRSGPAGRVERRNQHSSPASLGCRIERRAER